MILWSKDGERLLAFCTFLESVGIHQTWDSVYPTGTTTHVSNGKKAVESAGGRSGEHNAVAGTEIAFENNSMKFFWSTFCMLSNNECQWEENGLWATVRHDVLTWRDNYLK
ncbi:hypothetical protein NQZ79_g1372 [Umbelopsis isabellina]|nr:hypothetical protein NQZ79_g1372 [Umbelopsis isabellina]